MSTITALNTGNHAKKRVNLFLDGKFAFSLEEEEVNKERLKVGMELSSSRLDELVGALQFTRCLNAAYRYLGYRPRSEAEIRERLQRRGFPPEHIDKVIEKLKEQELLNDESFARFWTENRATFRPRSRGLTRSELRRKGVAEETISQVVNEINDAESAYAAAISKAGRLQNLEYSEFRQRLADFLKRRGFTYDIISRTIRRVWQEIKENE
jgi:regulatory protein